MDNGYSDEIDNHELLSILLEVKEGNFSVRMPGDKLESAEKYVIRLMKLFC